MSTTEVVWPSSYCLDGDEEKLRMLEEKGGEEGEARFTRAMSAALSGADHPQALESALVVGLLKEYTSWRERRVESIQPITDLDCETSISLQIRIPRRIVLEALDRGASALAGVQRLTDSRRDTLVGMLPAPDGEILRGEKPLKCILPVGRFPKRALMGLSVRDQDDNIVSLLTRRDGATCSVHFLAFLLSHAGIADDRFEPLMRILRASIYSLPFGREQGEYCRSIGITGPLSSPEQIGRWVVDRIGSRFPHFVAPIDFPWGMWDRTGRALKDYFDYYGEHELPFFYEGYKNAVRSPLMLAFDYLEYHSGSDGAFGKEMKVQEVLEEFFQDCLIFAETVQALADGRYGEEARCLVDEIASFWRKTVLFASCEVLVDRSSTFRVDQIQPLSWVRRNRPKENEPKEKGPKRIRPKVNRPEEDRAKADRVKDNKPGEVRAKELVPPDKRKPSSPAGQGQRKYGRNNSQRFDVPIGDARSTHIEIRSPDPANLVIDAPKSHIELGDNRLAPLKVFDVTSYTPGVQHFYTTKEYSQVAHIIRNNLEPPAEDAASKDDSRRMLDEGNVALRVTFTLRSTLKWLHRGALSLTITAIVLVGLIAGLRLFGKANTYTGNMLYFLVFLALALAASLFALFPMRDASPMVAGRLEVMRKLQLFSLVVLWIVTVVSLIIIA